MTAPNDHPPKPHSIELEVEVPGTPGEVWEAIATGPGIAAWFVPAEVAEQQGGTASLDVGWGMQDSGTVTAWDPPRRFAYVEELPASDAAPAGRLATEFLVEARSGGTCVLLLRTDEPAPGTALVAAFTYGGEVYASLHAYLFGDQAPGIVAREEPAWRAWMAERFPSAPSKTGATAER
jgi:uncharacterized protein YndB with AHSA1/START domain